MIAQELEITLHKAFVDARERRHEFITVEHLLLALLNNPTAREALRACGADMESLRKDLALHVSEHTPRVPDDQDVDTQPTLGFQRVIQRAILHVQSSRKEQVTGADLLVAIFGEKDSHAVYFLKQQGVVRLNVLKYVSDGIAKAPDADEEENDQNAEDEKSPLHADESLQVVLLKDETPTKFVVALLQDFLLMTQEEAAEVVEDADREGKAVCGLYPREVAEFIVQQVLAYAHRHGHLVRFETAIQSM